MFKDKLIEKRFMYLHPWITLIMMDARLYCHQMNLPFLVTETVTTKEEDDKISRKSSTHRTGRAFDLALRGWTKEDAENFCEYLNVKFLSRGALVEVTPDGKLARRLCVYGDKNHLDHIHVQIDARYAINDLQI